MFHNDWTFEGEGYTSPVMVGLHSTESSEQEYFGISSDEADHLFYSDDPRSSKEEAECLKAMLRVDGFNYTELLEEAKAIFGRRSRIKPITLDEGLANAGKLNMLPPNNS